MQILDKIFDGQNFRHQAEISTALSVEFLSDKIYGFTAFYERTFVVVAINEFLVSKLLETHCCYVEPGLVIAEPLSPGRTKNEIL